MADNRTTVLKNNSLNEGGLNEDTFNYIATDQLEDLLLPPAPPVFNSTLWLVIGLLLCLFAMALWRWQKHRNTAWYLAKKNLHVLEQQSKNTADSSQETAIQLASLLRQGLGVKRLDQYQPQDIHAWNTFQNKLNVACYSDCDFSDSSESYRDVTSKQPAIQKGHKSGMCASLRQAQDKPSPLSRTASPRQTQDKLSPLSSTAFSISSLIKEAKRWLEHV